MKLIDKIKNKYYAIFGRSISTDDRGVLSWLGVDTENTPRRAISQTTYYISLKTLSEAIGKLPLKLY